MKIIFTGGGTGGHFYPIIAVAEALNQLIDEERLVRPELYYFATDPYDPRALYEQNIQFHRVTAGKRRRYFSLRNFFDLFKTAWGALIALGKTYWLYPDVVFSKGGYVSFPTLLAARLLRIPVVIHESDSRPGRVNAWSAKFAKRVAVSYPEAATFFPSGKTAVTGNPIRQELLTPITVGAREFLKLEEGIPLIFITGGSQGAAAINDALLDIVPELIKHCQIIHQVGAANLTEVEKRAHFLLADNPAAARYKTFASLNTDALRMVAGVADLIITRAGSFIFEAAHWGIPAIIIPIPEEISHDQRSNAFTYARSGGAIVIEQGNLTSSILRSEIDRLLGNRDLLAKMSVGAKNFSRPDAAKTIAQEILKLALRHEE